MGYTRQVSSPTFGTIKKELGLISGNYGIYIFSEYGWGENLSSLWPIDLYLELCDCKFQEWFKCLNGPVVHNYREGFHHCLKTSWHRGAKCCTVSSFWP